MSGCLMIIAAEIVTMIKKLATARVFMQASELEKCLVCAKLDCKGFKLAKGRLTIRDNQKTTVTRDKVTNIGINDRFLPLRIAQHGCQLRFSLKNSL